MKRNAQWAWAATVTTLRVPASTPAPQAHAPYVTVREYACGSTAPGGSSEVQVRSAIPAVPPP